MHIYVNYMENSEWGRISLTDASGGGNSLLTVLPLALTKQSSLTPKAGMFPNPEWPLRN